MKIVEKKSKRRNSWWKVVGKECSIFHTNELCQAFDIPEGVKTVWMSLHDRPGINRVIGKVKMTKQYGSKYPCFVSIEFPKKIEWTDEVMDKILEPLIGKTLHLQCEYEA